MLRLLALSLLALAAPQAAAQQVHPGQADSSSCSAGMSLDQQYQYCRDYLDRPQVHPCLAETPPCSLAMARAIRDLDETSRYVDGLWRETGPGTPAWEQANYYNKYKTTAPPEPRHHVPYPLSRELLTGAVNPCAGSRPACPWELENIYDGLEIWGDDKDSWHYEWHLFQLEKYYRNHQH